MPTLQSIARVRQLAKEKEYVIYGKTSIGQDRPEQLVVATIPITEKLAPRAYIFAYDAVWKSLDGFTKALRQALLKVPGSHVHGVIALSKEWFAYQVPFTDSDRRVKHYVHNSLLSWPIASPRNSARWRAALHSSARASDIQVLPILLPAE